MFTLVKLLIGLLLMVLPFGNVQAQVTENRQDAGSKRNLTLRPNSRDNNPVRLDNNRAKILKVKKPDLVNPGKHLAKGHEKIKPNKKAIQQRREARKNRIKLTRKALKR